MPDARFPTVTVLTGWTRTYDPWLTVARGERLTVGRRDDEWPGWVWCDTEDGRPGGWLPERLLQPPDASEGAFAHAKDIYQTRELTVRIGDRLEVLTSDQGWLLCRAADGGIGWVPTRHVTTGS